MGIPVVEHVPGVGQNLQDHLEMYVVQKCKRPMTLLRDQSGLRMIRIGVQWFLNQTGMCSHFTFRSRCMYPVETTAVRLE